MSAGSPAWYRRSRLAFRIYAVGLLQFIVVAIVVQAVQRGNLRTVPFAEKHVGYVAEDIARVWSDPEARAREVERAAKALSWNVDVLDADGRLVAQSSHGPPRRESDEPRASAPIVLRDGREGRLDCDFATPTRPVKRFPGIVLVALAVTGVLSLFIARSLARPLSQLAGIARAFGSGHLDARARMSRTDEIGELARAFDDMAERVTALLVAERELLANVSHELRTPMARIRVALDLASEGMPMTEESIREVAEDLAELERLVEDVLTAARLAIDAPRAGAPLPIRKERLDMHGLLTKAVARFRSAHPRRELRVELNDDLPSVLGDAVLVRRVVDNLLENAHKYTDDAAASITLRAAGEIENRLVRIEIEDHGIGIAPEDQARLFQPFFRADRSRARATGGLGLGLTLVRRVVDAHGGTIALRSAVGEGTTIDVRLPAK